MVKKKKSPITQAAPFEKVDKREKTIWSIAIKRPVSISKLTPNAGTVSSHTKNAASAITITTSADGRSGADGIDSAGGTA